MLTLTTLASGSSGNCILLSGGGEHILIDAGISCRRICRSLRALGVEPESLSGVLITHEHTDHISGLATLTKQFRLPVYASPGTARQLCYRIAALEDVLHACAPGGSFTLGSLDVETFPTLHDAAEPWAMPSPVENRRPPWSRTWALSPIRSAPGWRGPGWWWWSATTIQTGWRPAPTHMR